MTDEKFFGIYSRAVFKAITQTEIRSCRTPGILSTVQLKNGHQAIILCITDSFELAETSINIYKRCFLATLEYQQTGLVLNTRSEGGVIRCFIPNESQTDGLEHHLYYENKRHDDDLVKYMRQLQKAQDQVSRATFRIQDLLKERHHKSGLPLKKRKIREIEEIDDDERSVRGVPKVKQEKTEEKS